MAQNQVEMGNKLISVATTEIHPPLAQALRKYGRSVHIAGDIVNAQVREDSLLPIGNVELLVRR